jgi:hypothetical protein
VIADLERRDHRARGDLERLDDVRAELEREIGIGRRADHEPVARDRDRDAGELRRAARLARVERRAERGDGAGREIRARSERDLEIALVRAGAKRRVEDAVLGAHREDGVGRRRGKRGEARGERRGRARTLRRGRRLEDDAAAEARRHAERADLERLRVLRAAEAERAADARRALHRDRAPDLDPGVAVLGDPALDVADVARELDAARLRDIADPELGELGAVAIEERARARDPEEDPRALRRARGDGRRRNRRLRGHRRGRGRCAPAAAPREEHDRRESNDGAAHGSSVALRDDVAERGEGAFVERAPGEDDPAGAIDDQRRRDVPLPERVHEVELLVDELGVRDLAIGEEAAHVIEPLADRDPDDDRASLARVRVEADERRHLLATGVAPRRPQADERRPPREERSELGARRVERGELRRGDLARARRRRSRRRRSGRARRDEERDQKRAPACHKKTFTLRWSVRK